MKPLPLQDFPEAIALCHQTSISHFIFLLFPSCNMVCLGYLLPLSFVVLRLFIDIHTYIHYLRNFPMAMHSYISCSLCWFFPSLFHLLCFYFSLSAFLHCTFTPFPILSQFSQTYSTLTATGKKSKKARAKRDCSLQELKGWLHKRCSYCNKIQFVVALSLCYFTCCGIGEHLKK